MKAELQQHLGFQETESQKTKKIQTGNQKKRKGVGRIQTDERVEDQHEVRVRHEQTFGVGDERAPSRRKEEEEEEEKITGRGRGQTRGESHHLIK